MTSFRAPAPIGSVVRLTRRPTFSVVIPTYQSAATVGEAIASALAQVEPPHEVIVVDDGSTDDLDGALAPFLDRIQVIRKTNGGVASALNAGMRAASGDFFAILDADDLYHERRLEVLGQLAVERPDVEVITTDAQFVVEGQIVGRFSDHNAFATNNQRSMILMSCFVGGWPAVCLRRLREAGGFNETLRTGSDWDCWIRLLLQGAQAGLVELPYYHYNLHSGSLTANRISSLWDRVDILEHISVGQGLHDADRPILAQSLRLHRSRAAQAEISALVGTPGTCSRFLAFARDDRITPLARAQAVLAAGAPGIARRLLPRDQPPEHRFSVAGDQS